LIEFINNQKQKPSMKKSILMVALLVATVSVVNAQAFEKGTNVVSIGVGLGSSLSYYSGSNQTPGLSLQYEKGVFPISDIGVISLGGYLGYKSYNYKYSGYKDKWTYTIIGARSAFHLTKIAVDKLDLYGGLMLSYNNLKYKSSSGYNYGSYGSTAGLTAYVGGRYFFTDNIGAMVELGYGVSYLTLGASLKF
jgi:hypothetical protein